MACGTVHQSVGSFQPVLKCSEMKPSDFNRKKEKLTGEKCVSFICIDTVKAAATKDKDALK